MSELVVLVFDQEDEAEQVRHALRRQEQAGTLDLEDTAVVVRDAEGKVHVNNQASDTTKWTAVGGGILGLMVGVFFFPLMGVAAGVAGGALLGRVLDRGIDGAFVKEVSAALAPGNSALFIMINSSRPDAAIATLRGFKGKVYHTTLEGDAEESLRRALHEQTSPRS
jgi:uncharacterized membrane protein